MTWLDVTGLQGIQTSRDSRGVRGVVDLHSKFEAAKPQSHVTRAKPSCAVNLPERLAKTFGQSSKTSPWNWGSCGGIGYFTAFPSNSSKIPYICAAFICFLFWVSTCIPTHLTEFGGAWDNTAASKPKTPVLKAHTTLKSHHSMCLELSLVRNIRNKMSSVGYEITWKTWSYRFIPPIYIYLWFTIVLPTLSDFSKGKPGLSSSSAIRLMAWREPEGWPRLRRGFGKSGEINACFL